MNRVPKDEEYQPNIQQIIGSLHNKRVPKYEQYQLNNQQIIGSRHKQGSKR